MTAFGQRIQKDINDLIRSVSETKEMILPCPLLAEFFDGDHNAAIFMNQVLFWTDRTTDPDGWFYKTYDDWDEEIKFSYYQVQRVIFGDERVQNPKRNLADVGLETKVKMAPNGRNATFYRLDVPQFVGMLVDWIEENSGHWQIVSFQQPLALFYVGGYKRRAFADTTPIVLHDHISVSNHKMLSGQRRIPGTFR